MHLGQIVGRVMRCAGHEIMASLNSSDVENIHIGENEKITITMKDGRVYHVQEKKEV